MICKDVRSGTGLLGSVMLQLIAVVLLSTLGDAELTGEYLSPAGCVAPNCDYTAKWSLDQSTDEISFTITAKQPEGTWTAIAFGSTMNMENQDTIYGYVDTAGVSHVVDAYVGAQYTRPVTDAIQNLISPNIAYANGIYTMTFKRKRVSADTAGDVNFTDQATLYFKYPVGGGPMQGSTPDRHTSTPKVSPTMVCVCAAPTSPMALPTTTITMAPMSSSMALSSPVAGSTTVMGPSTPPSPPPSGPSMPPSGPSMPPSGPSPPPSPPPSGPSPPPSPPPSGPSMPPSGPSMPPSGPSMPPSGPSMPPSGPSMPPSGPSMPPSGPSMPPSGTGGTSPMPTGTATLGSSSRTRTATIVAAVVAFVVLASIICLFACCFLPERNIAIQRI